MSTPDQLEKLDERVSRLEDRYQADIVAINAKLDGLGTLLNSSMVANVKHACPSPGSCVGLGIELRAHIAQLGVNTARQKEFENRLAEIEKWQSKCLGVLAATMVIFGMFGPSIRKLFGLE